METVIKVTIRVHLCTWVCESRAKPSRIRGELSSNCIDRLGNSHYDAVRRAEFFDSLIRTILLSSKFVERLTRVVLGASIRLVMRVAVEICYITVGPSVVEDKDTLRILE